jgi:hypothetical protein
MKTKTKAQSNSLLKRTVCGLSATALATGLLLAQGKVGSGTHRYSVVPSYDPKTPPPVSLPEAYALAVAHIGTATNQFHCVAASCLEMTNAGFTGWTFSFSDTNGQRGRVVVYFDKEVSIVARSGEVLISK